MSPTYKTCNYDYDHPLKDGVQIIIELIVGDCKKKTHNPNPLSCVSSIPYQHDHSLLLFIIIIIAAMKILLEHGQVVSIFLICLNNNNNNVRYLLQN